MATEERTSAQEQNLREHINYFADFYTSRTRLWKSLLFLCLESLIPGIVLWLFFSKDIASISVVANLPDPHAGYSTLICLGYIAYTVALTTIVYFLKGHKADNFTYSITLSFVISSVILMSFALDNHTTFIFIKFIITFVVVIAGGVLGVIITGLFNNAFWKHEEMQQAAYEKMQAGEELTPREAKAASKYAQQQAKAEVAASKSAQIQKALDEKLAKALTDEKEN